MNNCQTLLRAGLVITQNPSREILENSALAIGGGHILDIGSDELMTARWNAAETLDLRGMLVMPGLINAHAHGAMTFLRGMADDLPLMEWLEQKVFPVEARLNREIVKLGSLLGYAEMLASGCVACIDMYIFEDAVLEAADLAGLRCLGGEAVFAFPSAACPDWRAALLRTRELASRYGSHERLAVAVNPHSVYTTTPQILGACRDTALELGLPIHIHLAETENETSACLKSSGMRPVACCQASGLLDARLIAAHLVDISEDEIRLLAEHGVCAVHNPSSNMKLGSGRAPVPLMLASGLRTALGTDGPASNNQLNVFAEMRQAALLHKLGGKDPTALDAAMVLDMATLGGAAAFGNSELGSLEIGKAADCIALDLKSPNLLPMHNPVSQVVYGATGHECRMTMVAGEVLYRDGRFSRFDYEALAGEAEKLVDFAVNAG